VTRTDSGYQGTIGVGDAEGARNKHFNNLRQNNLQILTAKDSILIGFKRSEVTDKLKMNLIAAVGSDQKWNDDLPTTGFATIDLGAERPKRGLREIDLSCNNLAFPADYKTLSDARPPLIIKKGHGKESLILIRGMYSGAGSFSSFIDRNQSRYKFYVVTPPGLNGTPARAMPASDVSFSELTWTRRLKKDILDLIGKQKLRKPIIVAERQPGSLAAIELAIENPDKVGGVILAGTNLVQFFPAPKDPTRKTPATFEERIAIVDEGLAAKWFKYVTPGTWNSNDIRPEMLSRDLAMGEKASQEIEAAPLPVKIRYLLEFWASDVTRNLDKLHVPVLALIPGFDDMYLANPSNSLVKMVYIDSWHSLVPTNPNVELVKITDARLLVSEDQPNQVDDAIAAFTEKLTKNRSH
jgi:pimeloyl-ACP methyl ester carboxylesterase